MASSCYIRSDAAEARLIGDAAARWSCVPMVGDQKPDVEGLRARATQAAQWTAGALGSKRRMPLVCVDAAGSTCLWLRSPNDEEPVLSATMRTATQDWGDNVPLGVVQRLVEPAGAEAASSGGLMSALRKPVGGKGSASAAPNGGPVLAAPLALVRLYLDELDALGVRVDQVCSIWHAMASAWGADDKEITAVLLCEPRARTEWCWSRGGALIAGGSVIDEHSAEAALSEEATTDPAERTLGRLALDWLSWSAHLNLFPTTIVVVGAGGEDLKRRLESRWPTMPARAEPAEDALASTVQRAAQVMNSAAASDPRRTLVRLTQRPTRARRAQYLWAAAALVCLAASVGALGYRMMNSAGAMREAAVQADAEAKSQVESLEDPLILQGPSGNLVKVLESRLTMLRGTEPVKGPPTPKPIHEEIKRLSELLAKYEGVRLVQLTLDSRTPISLQLNVPDRRTGEEIRLALAQNPGPMRWTEAAGAGTDQVVRLSGVWEK